MSSIIINNSSIGDDIIEPTIRQVNKQFINKNDSCTKLIEEIKAIKAFIDNLGNLVFARDFIICKNYNFSLQTILTSAQLTIGSIISCCNNGYIADANLLLRKYRDDMFFYLYIIIYDSEFKYGKNVDKIQKQIIQTMG